jgi:thiopeptide-type bacteriocin biosynthesis protein
MPHRHAGFAVVRAPLLPWDELVRWSGELETPSVLDQPEALRRALERDRSRLRDRLRSRFSDPVLRDALWLASPDLEKALSEGAGRPAAETAAADRGLLRYFLRMASRPTPFGLFAGCGLASIGEGGRFRLGDRSQCRRLTRLDMGYLEEVSQALIADPAIRAGIRFGPNSSIYRITGRLRYVEGRTREKARTYHLVAVDATPALLATLERAAGGALPGELAHALEGDSISREAAEGFVDALIDAQLLIPELAPLVTGPEPLASLTATLATAPAAAEAAGILRGIDHQLQALDQAGLGCPPGAYQEVAERLRGLPAPVELNRLFQVDLVQSAAVELGADIATEVLRGVEALRRLFGAAASTALERFRTAFSERYEGREVLLFEALDEEAGVGLGVRSDPSPLLRDIGLRAGAPEPETHHVRDLWLLRRVGGMLQRGETELALTETDLRELDTLDTRPRLPLPASFGAMVTLCAASEEALRRGRYRVHLRSAGGPPCAALLGRFCHADRNLQERVEAALRAEEALEPDAVFAEIVHLPEGRIGNVIGRPVLREYEIPFLGGSGAPREQQIPVSDLRISVRDGRFRLRSERLDREVVPRMSNAHNFSARSIGVYRFLCMLQYQGVAGGLSWHWGPLDHLPFLPRVTLGRLVLSAARWRLHRDELKRLHGTDAAEAYSELQRLRVLHRLPRWVALSDFDNVLPLDLDNPLCVETLVHLVRNRPYADLLELPCSAEDLALRGPDGRYVHELIIPFVQAPQTTELPPGGHPPPPAAAREAEPVVRTFVPGSEWLYAKLYTGRATLDQVLREAVGPFTQEARERGFVDRWFFIRYADPDHHLRLRLEGQPETLRSQIEPALTELAQDLMEEGCIWKVQLDTYQREIERYGGPEGIELAESAFHYDSEATLEIVDALSRSDAGLDERWRLTLRGMDQLLDDFGLSLSDRMDLLRALRASFAREHRVDGPVDGQLGARFRKERQSLERLLDRAQDAASPLAPGLESLARRSERLAPIAARIRAASDTGALTCSLPSFLSSLLHMHANRLLRSSQRQQELVLYDFLTRLYESRAARKMQG